MNRVERLEKALEVAMNGLDACKKAQYPRSPSAEAISAIMARVESVLTPPPAYEDVEADGWAVYAVCSNKPLGLFPSKETAEAAALAYGIDHYIAYVNGPARRPLPAPVEKTAHGTATASGIVMDGEAPAPGTRCVVMWEEGGETAAQAPAEKVYVLQGVNFRTQKDENGDVVRILCPWIDDVPDGKIGTLTFTYKEDQ